MYCEKRWNCYDQVLNMTTNQPSASPTYAALDGTGNVTIQSNSSFTYGYCQGGSDYRAFMKLTYVATPSPVSLVRVRVRVTGSRSGSGSG